MNMLYKYWILTPSPGSVGGEGVCGKNICYHVRAFVIPYNLICDMTMFWKSWIMTFWPHPIWSGAGLGLGGSVDLIYYHHVAAFVVPLNLKKLNFDFLTQTQGRRDGVCGKICILCCCLCDSLKFDMQYDHVLKKVEFWPFEPTHRVVRGVCGQNICYHVAAFAIPINLICNMTMLWKYWNLTFWSLPQGRRGLGSASKICATILLHSRFPLIWYATRPCS